MIAETEQALGGIIRDIALSTWDAADEILPYFDESLKHKRGYLKIE